MKRICVFCGSGLGKDPVYRMVAEKLGILLAQSGIEVVYGGGHVGLMGVLADAVLSHNGKVTGILPQHIVDMEIAHTGLSRLIVVQSMQERKQQMERLSDGFIALPGGLGTLDELSEVLTYNQLRIHDKPLGLFNVNGYFNGLLDFFDHAVTEQFIRKEHRTNIIVSEDADQLIEKMKSFRPVQIGKWIDDIWKESAKT